MLGRLQSATSTLASKTNIWTAKTIYYGKVVAELSKQVYLKEGLQPPSFAEWKQVYCKLYRNSLSFAMQPKQALAYKSYLTKNNTIKYGAIGIQLAGFYAAGEAIGRWNLVGYKNHSAHH